MAGFAPVAGPGNRVLRFAVLLSVGLHLALLIGITAVERPVEPVPVPPPIQSRLVEAQEEVPVAKAEAPPTPRPREPAKVPRLAKPAPPAPAPAPAPAAQPVPRASAPAPEPAAEPPLAQAAPPPSPPASPVTAESPILVAPRPGPQPREEASEARARGEFRRQVIAAARRDKELNKERYSRIARATNWTGRVRVVVAVEANGKPGLHARKSSGHPALDQQAVEMFTQAVRAVPIPDTLRGRAFAFEVTAVFELEE